MVIARAVIVIVIALVAGCGEPTPLACEDHGPCGGGQCVAGYCASLDPSCSSGLRYHESAGSIAGDCAPGDSTGGGTGAGAEIQQLRDTNAFDASNLRDDIRPSCAAPGGRDTMFDIRIASPQRLYVDTFGTVYPVVLAVYPGTCASLHAGSVEHACVQDGCKDGTQQWSDVLSAGSYCVVVDQRDTGPASTLVVRSTLGRAAPLGSHNTFSTGTTCTPNEVQASCNAELGGEASWFFMTCGGTFTANTCDDFDFLGFLSASGLGGAPLACASGCTRAATPYGIAVTLPTPGPVWLVADDIEATLCDIVDVYVTVP